MLGVISAGPLQAPQLHHRVIVRHSQNGDGVDYSNEGGRKVKTAIITLTAAALIAAAPAAHARNVSTKAPEPQHKVFKKRPQVVRGHAPWRVMHANGLTMGYPGAFSYAPAAPKDYTYENSRNGGGGGGGGGGGM